MLGKKRLGEIDKVGDDFVARVGPVAGKLEAVARFSAFAPLATALFLDMRAASGVAVVLSMGPVGNDKHLYIFIQTRRRPKAVALVAVDLVESFSDSHAAPLQLDMDKRQAVDQYRHIIARFMRPTGFLVLVDDLKTVIMDVLFIEQIDILDRAVVAMQKPPGNLFSPPGLIRRD